MGEAGPALGDIFGCSAPSGMIFLLVAFVFYGLYGFVLTLADNKGKRVGWSNWDDAARLMELLRQILFNAAGGFAGWVAVYFLWSAPFERYGWRHLGAVIVAFVGVSGGLPFLSQAIPTYLVAVAKRMLDLLPSR